ncbi:MULTISPECIES: hypothetical protein [unclassified Leclercia]|uniref:hypothetical protein n=1 Tax=unclassified Leclercia TaxID=2627398 RepID=UPI0025C2123D|nr:MULTISPECIES: hypothetical protein [unclassified Leclercia]
MKNHYFIPGFEPDEIHDMAKSALKQIHERKVNLVTHGSDEPNLTVMDVPIVNLNEQYEFEVHYSSNNTDPSCGYGAGVSAGYRAFHQNHYVTHVHKGYEIDITIHDFDRQLDSADHGKNVVAYTTSSSKKVAQ